MKNYFITLLVCLGLYGCSQHKETNVRYTTDQISSLQLENTKVLTSETDSLILVDLNPFLGKRNFNFQDLVKEVRLVPLETTEESLVDAIYKVLPTASHIYIYDRYKGGGIAIFDHEGKFIRRIPNGQGPGELSRLYDIDFDRENNQLIAYQHSFLLFFTSDGEYIRQERLPFGFYNIVAIPDGYLIYAFPDQGNGHFGEFKNFTFWVTDKKYKINSVALPSNYGDINYIWYRYIYKNEEIMVTQRFNDTIYQYDLKSDRLKSKYLLDFNDKKLPEQYLKGTYEDFKKVVNTSNYYFFIGEYLETEGVQVFYLENWNKAKMVFYRDKNSGNLIGGTHPVFNAKEIPTSMVFPKGAYGDELISWYIAHGDMPFTTESSIISESDKKKVQHLTEEDNAVLVFFKLNHF